MCVKDMFEEALQTKRNVKKLLEGSHAHGLIKSPQHPFLDDLLHLSKFVFDIKKKSRKLRIPF